MHIDFIPFEKFSNITYLAKGGFGKIFKTKCYNGINNWSTRRQRFDLQGNSDVVLKSLNDSKNIDLDFLTNGLVIIHENQSVHKDLHSGNILVFGDCKMCKIGDFGISRPANTIVNGENIYGVIPYVAPEIFNGERYTAASDIYSFGMVIWELTSGLRPHSNRDHDGFLILNILNGLRPEIVDNTPLFFVELMEKCWDADPLKRPTADHIYQTLNEKLKSNEGFLEVKKSILNVKASPQAIFSSRPLDSLISTALILQKIHSVNYVIITSKRY
ncbi:16949_t:CDS:2 [Racocetra fulgida]|uniref:16949_t:CDS:1 n=1 Tax=Racocetra fulgida TaxID=60492 RepID=A0A9N8VG61_9GLOM|nr:16949_t:CDS:2 [Racocetra fulgida]